MNDADKEKLLLEVHLSEGAKLAWEQFFAPYFDAKIVELFESFKNYPITDERGIMIIKQQAMALDGLKDELLHHINTGKMATKSLNEEEEKEDGN